MQSKIKIFRFNNKIEDYANKKLGYSELGEIVDKLAPKNGKEVKK